jgi:hypothetical protein
MITTLIAGALTAESADRLPNAANIPVSMNVLREIACFTQLPSFLIGFFVREANFRQVARVSVSGEQHTRKLAVGLRMGEGHGVAMTKWPHDYALGL